MSIRVYFLALGTIVGSIYFVLAEASIMVAGVVSLFISSLCFTNLSNRRLEILSLLSGFLIVFFNYNIRSELIEFQNIETALKRKDTYLKVINPPKDKFFKSSYIVELKYQNPNIKQRLRSLIKPVRFIAHSSSSKAIKKGDIVYFDSEPEISKISNARNQFYKKDQTFYEIKKPELLYKSSSKSFINELQSKIANFYFNNLSTSNAEIVCGLLFGSRASDIPQNFIKSIRQLGLGHFFAASGFHVLTLVLIFSWILKTIKIKENYQAIILIPIIVVYSGLAGFSPSIVRATIFIVSFLLLKLLKRKVWSIKFLILLAGIVLFIDPYTIFDIGFQLSYLATLSLMIWAKPIKDKLTFTRLPDYILDIVSVTLSVQIFLLPLIIYFFNSLQIWSIIANLIFTPILSLIIVASFLGLSFMLDPLLNLVQYMAKLSNNLPFIDSNLDIDRTSLVLLFILFNSLALLLFTNHSKQSKPSIKLNETFDINFIEFLRTITKNTYTISSIAISSLLLILALNLDPIGLKKIIIEDGVIIKPEHKIFKQNTNHSYFNLHGKKALIIKNRSSLKKLNDLINNIEEVDILFLPQLNSKDIYLGRLVELINPQFTIISYNESQANNEKLKKNVIQISQHSNTIVNSGVIYLSEDKFWSLKN
jgi:ComEC/Rec2-related protein